MHLENTVGEFPFHADLKKLVANSAILSAKFFFSVLNLATNLLTTTLTLSCLLLILWSFYVTVYMSTQH